MFDFCQVRLAGLSNVLPYPLTRRVYSSTCVRIGGGHSRSYPATTIGGGGGIGIHAPYIALHKQFSFMKPKRTVLIAEIFNSISAQPRAFVREK
jgi:hypothetical protein